MSAPCILMYHEVRPEDGSDYLYSLTPDRFAAHLRWITDRAEGADPKIEIGFDDGAESVHRHAAPLLARHGLTATMFITVGWTGVRAGYMDWAQLKDLAAAGHSLQSHGWSHAFLSECAPDQLREELTRPKSELEDQLGRPVTEISMPGGRWNEMVIAACAAAGYRRVYTSEAGAPPRVISGIEVAGRWAVHRDTGIFDLRCWAGDERALARRRWRGRLGSLARNALGPSLYGRLRGRPS